MLSDVLLFASKTESKPISSSLTISHNCSCHVCFHCVMQLRTLMRHFFTHFLFCAPRAGLPRPMFPNAQPCFKTMACCSKLRVVRQSGWDGARLSSQIPCCLPILSVSRPVCLNFPDSQSWRVFPFFFPFHQFLARSEKTPSRLGAPSCCWRTISNFCENHHRCFFLFSKFQFNQLCCCPSVSPVSFTPSQP